MPAGFGSPEEVPPARCQGLLYAPLAQIEAGVRRGHPARGHTHDVAVVGFGPVGATLAGLLGRRGLRVIVLDRAADIYPLPRAAHIDGTGLRTLQELGCLDDVLPDMIPNPGT